MSFSVSARFEQLNTAQKPPIFKLFFFHFVIIFYSLSSRPLLFGPLFLIVLHNGVKKIHARKAWFVTCIGTKNKDPSPWKTIFLEKNLSSLFVLLKPSKWCTKMFWNWSRDISLLVILPFRKIVLHNKIINKTWTIKN